MAQSISSLITNGLNGNDINQNNAAFNVTITSLVKCDIPQYGSILPQYPSTFNKDVHPMFKNKHKFTIYDCPSQCTEMLEECSPSRSLCVAGNKLPVLFRRVPDQHLMSHWESWVPGYEAPDIKLYEVASNWVAPIVTVFPFENLPPENHAIEPNAHYWLLSKHAIPHMGVLHPKHRTNIDEVTFPCMVKASHGKCCTGTVRVSSKAEFHDVISELSSNDSNEPVITDFVSDITDNFCVQFYLFRSGEMFWLGMTNQLFHDGLWQGGLVEWPKQTEMREKFFKTIDPVRNYLHNQGYFGFVGIDLLVTAKNEVFIIDVNPRINGTTPLLLLAPRMYQLGYPVAIFKEDLYYDKTSEQLVDKIESVNKEGKVRIIAMGISNVGDTKCTAALSIFGIEKEQCLKAFDSLS